MDWGLLALGAKVPTGGSTGGQYSVGVYFTILSWQYSVGNSTTYQRRLLNTLHRLEWCFSCLFQTSKVLRLKESHGTSLECAQYDGPRCEGANRTDGRPNGQNKTNTTIIMILLLILIMIIITMIIITITTIIIMISTIIMIIMISSIIMIMIMIMIMISNSVYIVIR